ncbi:mediator of RNA polymerase II transcription subunit 17-like [Stegodyphus dumicola]|uniref:mediator of RNA polymerase II transcription subunit 17-like n=1 Tax=Stegodyphus dumicola TaxID=202533 RepID=UPI0015AE4BC6|nr:mediator of RNA polymerase II transcription subunit 17-like [Stegodyphus dumicola]
MLTEVCVLVDVLNIAKEKRYMVIDPVHQEAPDPKPMVVLLQKKKALANAAAIILRGAERLRDSQCESARNRTAPDFHLELLHMRQSWRLKKVGNSILGDLSYRSAGSRYWQSGIFEVSKNEVPETPAPSPNNMPVRNNAIKVTLPNELEGVSYIQVSIQNDTETIASGELSIPLPHGALAQAETHWQQKLEAAQNVLFCKELFSQLASEAVQMQSSIPNLVVGNQITTSLFPGVQLSIGLCHSTIQDRIKNSPGAHSNEHKPVLEHSLHQLLRELHYNAIHHPMPHPVTSALGISKRRRLAGPQASDLETIRRSVDYESLLEQIIKQTRHVVLRLRTMYMIDTFACEIKDPLIVAHWACLNSPTLSSVKINIMTHGYETICRTPLVIHVEEKSLKAICRDGRTMALSYEAQELRYLLMCQVSQHQVNAAQALAKLMGWKVLSTCNNLGVGVVEPIGNASSVLMASPTGDRVIAVRCGPKTGVHVSVSYSPQQPDFYPSTLVRDRKWQNLAGSFREVLWEKMEGRNFMNKLEHLMASLTPC